jgi:hypothetical protein
VLNCSLCLIYSDLYNRTDFQNMNLIFTIFYRILKIFLDTVSAGYIYCILILLNLFLVIVCLFNEIIISVEKIDSKQKRHVGIR